VEFKGYINALYEIIKRAELYFKFNSEYVKKDIEKDIFQIVDLLKNARKTNNKLIFIGNGGSAGISSHMAIDYWKNGKIRAICFNEGALLTCVSNDFGYSKVFEEPLKMFADKGDVLVAISSSGQSENILNAVKAANELECRIITLSGFSSENPLRFMGDFNIYVSSHSYGFVELAHQIILHMILDFIVEKELS
jgi:D-sedoheptulose 7-phosphate isomerase